MKNCLVYKYLSAISIFKFEEDNSQKWFFFLFLNVKNRFPLLPRFFLPLLGFAIRLTAPSICCSSKFRRRRARRVSNFAFAFTFSLGFAFASKILHPAASRIDTSVRERERGRERRRIDEERHRVLSLSPFRTLQAVAPTLKPRQDLEFARQSRERETQDTPSDEIPREFSR